MAKQDPDAIIEEIVELRDGSRIRLRPVQGGDEARLQELLHRMTAEDVRRRFFAPIRELSPGLARRLANPLPPSEFALAALPLEDEAFLGVGRIAGDASGTAEYAIAVRSDQQGKGIGYLLMTRLVARARALGFASLWGDVLRDNERIRQMSRELGFVAIPHPSDPALLRVRKVL